MPSNQQKMYEYAINIAQLLSSDLPEDDATNQIGNLQCGKRNYPSYCCKTLSQSIQRDTVDIVGKAVSQGIPVYVPAILRSASIEFDTAFRPGGNQTPQIKRISENDERIKASRRSQPAVFPHRSGVPTVV